MSGLARQNGMLEYQTNKFFLHISLMGNCNRWVLTNCKSIDKKTSYIHTGYVKFDIGHLLTGIDLLSKNEIYLAQTWSHLNISLSTTAELLNIRNYLGLENSWNINQLFYKMNKQAMLNNDSSIAEKLISIFDNCNDCNYVYIFL